MREEILYQESRTGTTVVYFDTLLQPGGDNSPAYMTFDNLGKPYEVTTFDGTQMWSRNGVNNSLIDTENIGLETISGSVFTTTVDYIIPNSEKLRARQNFRLQMNDLFSGQSKSYMFFREQLVDDLFVTIGLERTEKILDTLSIYNNLKNSFPVQESDTGTVFGRLMAIQKIKDESGNNIKIPLRNVPIGIFNPSDTFSDSTSVDDNGSRVTLNLKEASLEEDYFNLESFSSDTKQYLQEGSSFVEVPSHYKYITYTNEEGEFVIHNVPVGTQTLIFEVDMFKQGLTKDEIALNFFPFPADNQPNIDTVPSFFFRQFPINVVPTWGNFQTGYTEVNINTNLDLRKWSTYFVPPASLGERTIEDLQANGISTPIQVQIRDMATEGFPIRNIEVVEIPDIRDREENQQLIWKNEFKQLKNRIDIRRNGWQAFKVPANSYDPTGFKTDKEGVPTQSKGVWLAAYQMKLFYDQPNAIYRATGQRSVVNQTNEFARRDHFHLNFSFENFENSETLSSASLEGASVGSFPYEKPWNHLYPEPYSIPKMPIQLNPNFYDNMGEDGSYILEHPLYLDGDRVGHPFAGFEDDSISGGTGGYGAESDINTGIWFKNDFSRLVTKNFMYRYENRENRSESYLSGYKPNIDTFPAQPGVSSVIGGEKYQRTESGYGYLLKPEGWARTAIYSWAGISEALLARDLLNPNSYVSPEQASQGGTTSLAPYNTSMSIIDSNTGQKTYLDLSSSTNRNIRGGHLDLYRIVNSNPNENLNPVQLGEIITQTEYNFGPIRIQNSHTTDRIPHFRNSNNAQDHWLFSTDGDVNPGTIFPALLFVQNLGVKTSKIIFGNGQEYTLAPGASLELNLATITSNTDDITCLAEGNLDFDYDQRIYTKSLYAFEFRDVRFFKNQTTGSATLKKVNYYQIFSQLLDAGLPNVSVPKVYLHSISKFLKTRSNLFGSQNCTGSYWQFITSIKYRGSFWDGAQQKRHLISYWSSAAPYSLTCTEDSGYQVLDSINASFGNSLTGDDILSVAGSESALNDID